MRVSTIDVGTNTVRLLVADVEGPGAWRGVTPHQTGARLGEGRAAARGPGGRAPRGAAPPAGGCRARAGGAAAGGAGLLGGGRGRPAAGLPAPRRGARPEHLVGTAGTMTTLAALDLGLAHYDPARVQGHALSRAAIERRLPPPGAFSLAAPAGLPCPPPGAAGPIGPGTAVVLATPAA